jgi:hypothetical protein
MHSSLKINLEGAAVTGASNGAGRGPSYVAFKIPFASLEVAWGTGGHINVDATLPIKCGAPHLMLEIGTYGSMSGDGKRGDAAWPKLPRPSSTLPYRPFDFGTAVRSERRVRVGPFLTRSRRWLPY